MKNIFPTPKSITKNGAEALVSKITECGFKLIAPTGGEVMSSAVARINQAFYESAALLPPFDGDFTITLCLDPADSRIRDHGDEAYAITVTETEASLVGRSERAVLYAAVTLSKLLYTRGSSVYLPTCEIVDYPDFMTRGMFAENRYNDFMTLDDWKSVVDTLADLKLNTLKVGLYGTWSMQYDRRLTQHAYIPYKTHPEIRAPKTEKYFSAKSGKWVYKPDTLPTMYREDFFGDIVSYGKTKGVEVIPLVNSLGHNSLIPEVIPAISAKDEDGNLTGYGLCTSNPETYKVYFELYDEIIDRYLKPNGITSFCVGLDEVGDIYAVDKNNWSKRFSAHCKCDKCRDIPVQDRMIDYMIKLIKHLKDRGMENIYVYYDMFFYVYGIMNEYLADILKREGVYDVTVMDWWNYGATTDFFRGKYNEVNGLFRSIIKPMSGYFGWMGIQDNLENMCDCSMMADKHNFRGIISYSNFDPRFEYNHTYLGESSWNAVKNREESLTGFKHRFFENKYPDHPDEAADAWSVIQHRLHPYNYTENPPHNSIFNQYTYSYYNAAKDYPRDHYSEILEKIDEKPEYHLGYLEDFISRADKALEFFSGDKAEPSVFNERLVADIRDIAISHSEIRELYRMYTASKDGKLSNAAFIETLDALIRRRKSMMIDVENIYLPTLVNQPLRIASICLAYLLELREAVLTADREGRVYTYDPTTAQDRNSPLFNFLH